MSDKQKTQQGEMRINKEELKVIKDTFKDNVALLKVMRKIFLPTLDANAPLGQMIDVYRTIHTEGKTPEEVKVTLEARNFTIAHVEQALIQLDTLAGMTVETEEEKAKRLAQDSAK